MFLVINLLQGIAVVLRIAVNLSIWLIIIRAILSWFIHYPDHPVTQFIYRSTDIILEPIRRRLPTRAGLDFSPLIAILALVLINLVVIQSLFDLAGKLAK